MRRWTTAVIVFALLLLQGDDTWAVAYSLSALTTDSALHGVSCGAYGQQCPDAAPICCGLSSVFYCAAAGSTCCTPRYPSWTASLASCAQGEACCAGDDAAICCRGGSVCVLEKSSHGLVTPHCTQTDACNAFGTADACLHATAGGHGCGWCCDEQRCVALTDPETNAPSRCQDGHTLPLAKGERCPSRCSYATTCALCEGVYQEERAESDSCTWCCATMSCMPSKQAASRCENEQVVSGAAQCDSCLYGGHGVNERMGSDVDKLLETIFSLLLIVAVVALVVVWRIVYDCVCGQSDTEPPSAPFISPQETVRRYGFERIDCLPSSPLRRHRGSGSADRHHELETHRCDVCARPFSFSRLQAQLYGITDSASSASKPSLGHDRAVAEPSATQPSVPSLASGRSSPPPVVHERESVDMDVPQHEGGDTHDDKANATDDDDVALLLPCCHLVCFPCLGVTSTDAASLIPERSTRDPIRATTQVADVLPDRQMDSPDVSPPAPSVPSPERADADIAPPFAALLLSRWRNKCPKCHTSVEDTVVPSKIISL